jgi:hypothetical protein
MMDKRKKSPVPDNKDPRPNHVYSHDSEKQLFRVAIPLEVGSAPIFPATAKDCDRVVIAHHGAEFQINIRLPGYYQKNEKYVAKLFIDGKEVIKSYRLKAKNNKLWGLQENG